jgi:formylglycine-generating enzyme required for sulfatase activity
MGSSLAVDNDSGGPSYDQPEHSVTVSAFGLDKYEVTVGRFRAYVAAVDAWNAAGHPAPGEGAHPNIPGSGWPTSQVSSNSNTLRVFASCLPGQTWTATRGANESLPIVCVDWKNALSFCIWDGGRLPTEAEWEYAAAGGNEERLFPWGSAWPGPDTALAVYGCYYGGGAGTCTGIRNVAPVGSIPAGNGRWGQSDLAGSVQEWTRDYFNTTWYSNAAATGTDVANLNEAAGNSLRGGSFDFAALHLRSSNRLFFGDPGGYSNIGFRCAR